MKTLLIPLFAFLLFVSGCATTQEEMLAQAEQTAQDWNISDSYETKFTIPSLHKHLPSVQIGERIYTYEQKVEFTSIKLTWSYKF